MEDQGKRIILAVVLAIGVMLAWSWLFPPEKPPVKPPAPPAETAKPAEATPTPGAPAAPGAAPVAEVARGPEQEIVLENHAVRAVFTSWGGAVKSWRLLDPKYAKTPSKGELLERPPGAEELPSLAISFADSAVTIPAKAEWQGEKLSETEVRYRYRTDAVEITKTFTYYPGNYLLRLVVEVKALQGELKERLGVALYGYQDPKIDVGGRMTRVHREWVAGCYVNGESSTVKAPDVEKSPLHKAGAVGWAGLEHPYLLVAAATRHEAGQSYTCDATAVKGMPGVMRVDLSWPLVSVKAGDPPAKSEVVAYMGPKFYDRLEGAATIAGFPTEFHKSVDMGWFAIIARPLLWLLLKFHALVGNWGIAIILLTVLVKLATLYWTTKSMRSMKAMASLKPKIEELQKKYADDRQRLQTEMMALYKVHGVNPLAGCLPMLLQMPIWLALYRMLSAAGELYQAPFIPGWISDLTATDRYYVLPIAMMVMMFAQSKLSPTAVDSAQQKILVYGLPLMFGVMGFFFPSGLSLYILTNSTLTAGHTLYMRWADARKEANKAAATAAAKKDEAKAADKAPAVSAADADDDDDEDGDEPAGPAAKGAPARASGRGGKRGGKKRKR